MKAIETDSGLSVAESGPRGGPEGSVYATIGTFGGGPLVDVSVEAAARPGAALIITIERTDTIRIMPTVLPVPSQLDAVMAESQATGNGVGGTATDDWKYSDEPAGVTSRLVGSDGTGPIGRTIDIIRRPHPTWEFVGHDMVASFADPGSHRTITISGLDDGKVGFSVEDWI